MASSMGFRILESVTYSRNVGGGLAIRRAPLPRLVHAALAGLLIYVATEVPAWPHALAAATAALVGYAWSGRPRAVFDIGERALLVGRRRILFSSFGAVHMIERRDEEAREGWLELLGGPRLVVRYEVYCRVDGAPLVLALFRSRAAAEGLTREANSLVAATGGFGTPPN